MAKAIQEGLAERKMDKEAQAAEEKESKEDSKMEAEELVKDVKIKGMETEEEGEKTSTGGRRPRKRTTTAKK